LQKAENKNKRKK